MARPNFPEARPETSIRGRGRHRLTAPKRWLRRFAALTAIAMVATGGALASGAVPAQAASSPTVVSLTFDDGNYDQLAAAGVMNDLGLTGTFYITSGFVDGANYLSQSDLRTIANYGNEIGGHTVTHPDLTTLKPAEAQREVCNDRVQLMEWGYNVRNFAYPFASVNNEVEQIVADCGYNSARGLGDLRTQGGECDECDYAEDIHSAEFNPYLTKAADEVDSSWTLERLQKTVTQAETNGGGWVQLTFHHVCDGCDAGSALNLGITPSLFKQFATWLAAWRTSTNTVKTVGEVIGGPLQPAVPGTPVVYATPPGPGVNGVVNPGLETIGDYGLPSCWYKAVYGNSHADAATVSPGRTGARAVQLTVSDAVANSDAKMLSIFTDVDCTPGVTPGATYSLRAWYKSDVVTQFVAYYRAANGTWQLLAYGLDLPPSGSYTHAEFITPAIPEGATGLSFGLAIRDNGTLTTDDYAMYNTVGAPAFDSSGDLTFPTQPVPTITGTAKVGETLTVIPGTWEPQPDLLSYKWAVAGSNVQGATGATYTPVADDAGKAVTVTATATRTGYAPASVTSAPTAAVAPADVVPLVFTTQPKPTITGTAKVGQVLTGNAGVWVPAPDSLTYQWSVGDSVVSSVTGSTYTPVAGDVGKTVTVKVTAAKAGYTSASATSAATAAVAPAVEPEKALTATPTPTISGTAQVGKVLTATPGSWQPAPVTLSYRWYVNGAAVTGATGTSYTPVAGDVGKSVTVSVTGSKAGYTSVTKTSAATAAVAAAVVPAKTLTATPTPTISGTAQVGKKLTASAGTWKPAPVSLTYQWFANGVAVRGATSASYTPVTGDVGKKITVSVTGSKAGYTSVTKTSAATKAVAAAPKGQAIVETIVRVVTQLWNRITSFFGW